MGDAVAYRLAEIKREAPKCQIVYDIEIKTHNERNPLNEHDLKAICNKVELVKHFHSTDPYDYDYSNHRLQFKDNRDGMQANKLIAYLKNLGCDIEVKGRWTSKEESLVNLNGALPQRDLAKQIQSRMQNMKFGRNQHLSAKY
jgi:hypothetical protein